MPSGPGWQEWEPARWAASTGAYRRAGEHRLPDKAAEPLPNVGRTSPSARDPLVRLEQVDQGVDSGPGGPPHKVL